MFHNIVEPPQGPGSRRAFVPLSVAAHAAAIVAAFLVPLMIPGALPSPVVAVAAFVSRDIVLPAMPPPAPGRLTRRIEPPADLTTEAAPVVAPTTIEPERIPVVEPGPIGTVEGVGNVADAIAPAVAVEPALVPAPAPAAPRRPGGDISPPKKVKDTRPVYPAIAQAARVEGVVIIEATIGTDGRVVGARVLRSIPLLDEAALDAVREWEYTPTLLNGSPVSIVMTVTVTFALR